MLDMTSDTGPNDGYEFRCRYAAGLRRKTLDRRWLIELEAEISNHLMRVGSFLSGRGEIAVDEDRVCRIEAELLQRAQVHFSTAGDADFFARIHEAKKTKRFQAALRRKLSFLLEGRFRNRVEKVHRDRFDVHGAQGER